MKSSVGLYSLCSCIKTRDFQAVICATCRGYMLLLVIIERAMLNMNYAISVICFLAVFCPVRDTSSCLHIKIIHQK